MSRSFLTAWRQNLIPPTLTDATTGEVLGTSAFRPHPWAMMSCVTKLLAVVLLAVM